MSGMSGLPGHLLHLPPGLDHSLMIPVWIGALCLFFFTECFGWGFVGLVVPGYLASVFISNPTSGWAVLAEVMLTLIVVRAHLDLLPKAGWVYSPFGRERFFLIVLWGTAVRIFCEVWLFGWLFALVPSALSQRLGLDLWQPDFFGIGLVLVPLTANMLWRNHLRAGGVQMFLATLFTFAVVRYGVMQVSNLSLSEFQLLYEDAALGLANQPKVYIILLVGALLAARANQLYGWDFNGILVPSLLAVSWMWPVKLVATLLEVIAVVVVARALVKLPVLRSLNIEGPRRIIIILTLDLGYKAVISMISPMLHEAVATSDLYGFGYLLPSLLATKIWVRRDIPVVVLPTIFVSGQSFVLGSALTFLLQLIPLPQLALLAPPAVAAEVRQEAPRGSRTELMVRASRAVSTQLREEALDADARKALDALSTAIAEGSLPHQAAESLSDMLLPLGFARRSFQYDTLNGQTRTGVALIESAEEQAQMRGLGAILLTDPGKKESSSQSFKSMTSEPVLWMIPEANVPGGALTRAAGLLARHLDASCVVVPGGRLDLAGQLHPSAMAKGLSQQLTHAPRLILAPTELGGQTVPEGIYLPHGRESWIPHALEQVTGPLTQRWQPLPPAIQAWNPGTVNAVAVVLTPAHWTALLQATEDTHPRSVGVALVHPPSAREWLEALTEPLERPDPMPSDTPSELRLAIWQNDVVKPLLEELSRAEWQTRLSQPTPELVARLYPIGQAALSLGYRLEVAAIPNGAPLVGLVERSPGKLRTGAMILRPAAARPWMFELSDPTAGGMMALSRQWLLNLDASALLIAGASTREMVQARLEGVLEPSRATFFQVMHEQVVGAGNHILPTAFPGESLVTQSWQGSAGDGSSWEGQAWEKQAWDQQTWDKQAWNSPSDQATPQVKASTPSPLIDEPSAGASNDVEPAETPTRTWQPVRLLREKRAGTSTSPARSFPVLEPSDSVLQERVTVVRMEAAPAGQSLPADVAVTSSQVLSEKDKAPGWMTAVLHGLTGLGLHVRAQEGESWSAALRLPPGASTHYSLAVGEGRFLQVRVSRGLRQAALGLAGNELEQAAPYLGLPVRTLNLHHFLEEAAQQDRRNPVGRMPARQLGDVVDALRLLQEEGGPSRVIRLVTLARYPGRRLSLVRDTVAGGAFLLSEDEADPAGVWLLNLSAPPRPLPEILNAPLVPDAEVRERFSRGYQSLLSLDEAVQTALNAPASSTSESQQAAAAGQSHVSNASPFQRGTAVSQPR